MKMLEEIKRAEEKGEAMKKDAELEGQRLLQQAREKGESALAALVGEKEERLARALQDAHAIAEAEIAKLDRAHEQAVKKIEETYKKNKDKAIKKAQEIILRWPSSR